MTTGKLIVASILLTGSSVAIGIGVGSYVVLKRAEQKLGVTTSDVAGAIRTVNDMPAILHDIRGDEEGEFGRRTGSLRAEYPFTPPNNGAITESQMQRFLSVRRRLHAVDLEMARDTSSDGQTPSAATLMKWNFFTRMKKLRDAQVSALEAAHMSYDEYKYVHGAVYATMLDSRNENYGKAVATINENSLASIDKELAEPATTPERRRELVEQRERIANPTARREQSFREIPQSNFALLEKYHEDLNDLMLTAIDLDAIDFFRDLEEAHH